MLLTPISFSKISIKLNNTKLHNFHPTYYFPLREKSFHLFSPKDDHKKESYSIRRSRKKIDVDLYSDNHFPVPEPPVDRNGIGIEEFFKGKNIFITGGTGFIGKVLIEKLLRSTAVDKIYVLIKAKDEEAALHRLTNEILNSELFKCLVNKHGKSYQEFVRKKLIAVAGNICETNLGMDSNSAQAIMKEVDVIVESAANTNMYERYDLILDANVNAPKRLMGFAKKCNNLKLFVHISTAYVCGKREGIIFEKPFIMGENRIVMDEDNFGISSSNLNFPRLNVINEISLASELSAASASFDVTKELKRLGQERSELHGWHDAYQMSKAMGEMVLNETKENVPLLIIRPAIVESTYTEPFPGWIQGNRMCDPVIISYGKGQLLAFPCDPQGHMDVMPVDMVANTTIAAIAKHGIGSYNNNNDINIYHVASGFVNPLSISEFFGYIHEYFSSLPLEGCEDISCMKFFDDFSDFSKYIREEEFIRSKGNIGNEIIMNETVGEITHFSRKLQKQNKARVAYAEQLGKMYEFMGFFRARFDTGNTKKLLAEMSSDERCKFELDATKIDWRKYFLEIHVPGLRERVINGTKISVT